MPEPRDVTTKNLHESIRQACAWLTDIAQVKQPNLADGPGPHTSRFDYHDWRGAIRGEYAAATKQWDFFCPIWHTGQAVAALALASQTLHDDSLLAAAKFSADFILRHRIDDPNDPDHGLILAFEDHADKVNTSAVMESLAGLLQLHKITNEPRYLDAAKAALDWIARKAFIDDQNLLLDLYDPKARSFAEKPYGAIGRPLIDDAVFLTVAQLTADQRLREIHYRISARLAADEYPAGNWIRYAPANIREGHIHPRHAYWWGYPFIFSYLDTRDSSFLQLAIRAGQWYKKAQRADGGLIRRTFLDFNTDCFGHATSGIVCAVKLWAMLHHLTNDPQWLEPIHRALHYCMMMQLTNPADPNLRGAIIEKILPPDGTDRNPIHLRDLATIFHIQAAAITLQLNLIPKLAT